MKEFSHEIKTNVPKENIWEIWSDVDKWNTWDKDIEWTTLEGPFIIGTRGIMKPAGGPKSKFILTEVTKNKSFTVSANVPLAKINFIHTLTEEDGKIIIKHSIIFSGLLSFLFAKIIGKKLAKTLPNAMNNLIDLAKNK